MDLRCVGLSSQLTAQYISRRLPIRHYVNQTPSVYAMDNWHVTPRLTLQLGLRYDALPQAWERSNAVANFDPALYYQPATRRSGTPMVRSIPTGPGFQTLRCMAVRSYYVNGMGLAGQDGFPRGSGDQRLQHAAASCRLL